MPVTLCGLAVACRLQCSHAACQSYCVAPLSVSHLLCVYCLSVIFCVSAACQSSTVCLLPISHWPCHWLVATCADWKSSLLFYHAFVDLVCWLPVIYVYVLTASHLCLCADWKSSLPFYHAWVPLVCWLPVIYAYMLTASHLCLYADCQSSTDWWPPVLTGSHPSLSELLNLCALWNLWIIYWATS